MRTFCSLSYSLSMRKNGPKSPGSGKGYCGRGKISFEHSYQYLSSINVKVIFE
jgi:hypothetical protein